MADPKENALVEELRASREQNAKTIELLAQLVTNLAPKPEQNVHEALASRMEQIRGGGLPKLVTVIENCTSPDTGATFDVEIQDGKVVSLRNYKHPPSAFLPTSQGGTSGRERREMYLEKEFDRDGSPKKVKSFATWLYQDFVLADLRRFVGKPCPKYLSETSKPAPVEPPAKTA